MTPQEITLHIPAKVNLSLDITGKRPDGYHTLRSIFQTIGIYDTLTVIRHSDDAPMTITCNDPAVPCDARNLVWKAAVRLLGDQPRGLSVKLVKRIPSQAGMGGGSADCAAALLGIRTLLRLPVSDAALHSHAAALGADVAFFLTGGTALAEGIGEILTPLPPMPERILVIAKGTEGVSTPAAYRALDALETPLPPHTDGVLAHYAAEDPAEAFASFGNDFDAVTDLEEVERIRTIMRENGVIPVLSGSGAAVFGGCCTKEQAERCADALRAAGLPFVRVCRTTAAGIRRNAEAR